MTFATITISVGEEERTLHVVVPTSIHRNRVMQAMQAAVQLGSAYLGGFVKRLK